MRRNLMALVLAMLLVLLCLAAGCGRWKRKAPAPPPASAPAAPPCENGLCPADAATALGPVDAGFSVDGLEPVGGGPVILPIGLDPARCGRLRVDVETVADVYEADGAIRRRMPVKLLAGALVVPGPALEAPNTGVGQR